MSYPIDLVRPTFDLSGKTFIVTGGAQGIGFAISHAVCEMGANVAVWDVQPRPIGDLDSLGSKFGVKTLYLQTDVTSQESLQKAFDKTLEVFRTVDGCVPAAGIAIDKPFIDQTWDEFNRIQEINVRKRVSLSFRPINQPIERFSDIFVIGSRHLLHRSARREGADQAGEAGEYSAAILAVCPHLAAGISHGSL